MAGMTFRDGKRRRDVTLNVTSLVDVLFLLLIFFMLTGTFQRFGELELRLPESRTAGAAGDGERGLDLVARKDGSLLLQGDPVALEDLGPRLRSLLGEDPDRPITIRAETEVPHGRVVQLLDVVREAGFRGVGIGTEIRREPGESPG